MTAPNLVQLRGIVRRLERQTVGGDPDWTVVQEESNRLVALVTGRAARQAGRRNGSEIEQGEAHLRDLG